MITDVEIVALASPFKGLAPFAATDLDALLFFGREREAELISANLMASRLTVLYGDSGVGKTSLLAAGVVHRLRATAADNLAERGHPEFTAVMFSAWSQDPVAALLAETRRVLSDVFGPSAASEPASSARLADVLQAWTSDLACDVLLVLDQVEEYFLYHEAETGPASFAEALPELVTRGALRVSVVLSIREDALAKLDRFKGRIPNLFGNYLRLSHLDRESARSAIVGPVRRYNELNADTEPVTVDEDLVEAVLDETAAGRVDLGQAGRGIVREAAEEERIEAPFLQLVLERLWDDELRRGSRVLRRETLRRLGGAAEIVRNHLDRALEVLTPAEKDLAANLFNYLVTPSGTKIAHAPADLAEYAAAPARDVAPVLTTLVRERILRPAAVRDGGTRRSESPVEIFHDVLADAVLAWRTRHEADRAVQRERRRAERRHRRAMLTAAAAIVAFAFVAAVAVFALLQRSEAREQAREARAQRAEARTAARSARAGELAARAAAQLGVDPDRALALAVRAAALAETSEIEDVLRSALIASRVRAVLPATGPVTSAIFSPNGRWILTASADGTARLYAARTRRLIHELDHGGAIRDAAFDARGQFVVTAGADGTARLWRTSSGSQLHTLRHNGTVDSAAFSPNGELLVTTGADRTARVWRTHDGSPAVAIRHERPARTADFSPDSTRIVTVSGDRYARVFDARSGGLILLLDHGGPVASARFSPTGRLLVTAGHNRVARSWSVATGRLIHEMRGHEGPVLAVVPGPRGKLLVTTSTDGSARIWQLPQGELRSVLTGHTNLVTGAAFDRAGFSLVTTSRDRTARVWKPSSGTLRASLTGHSESVTDASFSPDGREIVTASEDGTARVWDPHVQPSLSIAARMRGPLNAAAFSPDGELMLFGGESGARIVTTEAKRSRRVPSLRDVASVAFSSDGTLAAAAAGDRVTVWRVASGRRLAVLRVKHSVTALAFAPRGTELATAGADGLARVWRLSGTPVRAFRGHRRPLTGVAYSSDGQRLVTSSEDRTARIWDLRTGSLERVLRGHRSSVMSARFSTDGRRVVTASRDKDARTWDAGTGKRLTVLRGHFAVVSDAAFSRDGRWIVTAGPITAGLWDSDSGRQILYLRGPQARLTSASFDPSGTRLLVSSIDGTARTYDCEVCAGLDDLRALAGKRLAGSRSG